MFGDIDQGQPNETIGGMMGTAIQSIMVFTPVAALYPGALVVSDSVSLAPS